MIRIGAQQRLLRDSLGEALLIILVSASLGFAYTFLAGKGIFNPASPLLHPQKTTESSSSPFITYEEALALFKSGHGIFVDARHEFDFRLGHIPRAINLPLKEFAEHHLVPDILKKEALIITYCDGEECNSSIDLAMKLDSLGFSDVKIFFGGWKEWQSHEQPTEQ